MCFADKKETISIHNSFKVAELYRHFVFVRILIYIIVLKWLEQLGP